MFDGFVEAPSVGFPAHPSIAVLATNSCNKLEVYCGIADGVPRALSLSDPLSATRMIAALTKAGSSLSEDEPTSASGFVRVGGTVGAGVDADGGDLAGVDVDNGVELFPVGIRGSWL